MTVLILLAVLLAAVMFSLAIQNRDAFLIAVLVIAILIVALLLVPDLIHQRPRGA